MNKLVKIILIVFVIPIVCLLSIFLYLYLVQEDKVAVLTYHDVVDIMDKDDANTVNITTKKFEKQISWLHKHKYKSLSMNEFYQWKLGNKKIPRKSVLITFDDGWKSYYEKAVPILEKYNMKSSVFVVFSYVKNTTDTNGNIYMNFNDINDIIKNHSNMEILSHSYNLHDRLLADSNDYEIYNKDIHQVKNLGYDIKYYAYPYGHRNINYIKALEDNNYKLSFTFGPYDFATKKDNNYEIPRIGLFESTNDLKFKLKMFLEE